MKIKLNFDKIFLFVIAMLALYGYFFRKSANLVALSVMVLNIFSIIKYRKNIILLVAFLWMFYCDYSVIFAKYFYNITAFKVMYGQLKFDDTMLKSIFILFVFHYIVLFILNIKSKVKKNDETFDYIMTTKKIKDKYINMICYLLLFAIIFVIINNLFIHIITIRDTILEYIFIPILLCCFYGRNNYKLRNILFIIVMIYSFEMVRLGARVSIIEPLIAVVMLLLSKLLTVKRVILGFFLGIYVFTAAGLYGDNLANSSNKYDYSNIKFVVSLMNERKFTLDTSYSSYWTGLTFIESMQYVSKEDRLKNFIDYSIKYTFFGSNSNYRNLPSISRNYYVHCNGGYITSYFYYWLGFLGIFIISLYIGVLFRKINKLDHNSNDYIKIISIYIISTIPRWYLYNPTPLLRGILITSILYFITSKFSLERSNQNESNSN